MSNHHKMVVRTAYLHWLRSELQLLPAIPIRAVDRATRLPLTEVYVPLRVIRRAPPEETQQNSVGEQIFKYFSNRSYARMLLIGDAGSGKTMTLRYGALILVSAILRNDATIAERKLEFTSTSLPLPIYMRLTPVMKWLCDTVEGRKCVASATTDNPLLTWLDSQVVPQVTEFLELNAMQPVESAAGEVEMPSPSDWHAALATVPLSALIKDGDCFLLLDCLDETGDEPRRAEMQCWIDNLVHSYPQNRYLVASRPFKESAIPGFIEHHLSPLNDQEMEQLLSNWFEAAYCFEPNRVQRRNVQDEVAHLREILKCNPHLFGMCMNPLLLTSVALLVYTGVGLPRERAELYNRLVELLLEKWRILQLTGGKLSESRPVLFSENVGSVQRRLQQLAAWMQQKQRREVTLEEAVQLLAPLYVEDMEWHAEEARTYVIKQLLEPLALESGTLQWRDAGYSFAHYTLQEYLTARDYDQQPDGVDQLLELRTESRWKETILLAVGHWATVGVTWKAKSLLQKLLDTGELDALLLVGDALDDANAELVTGLAPVHRATTTRLRAVAALTDDWRKVADPDPVVRNRAATMLDRLDGDNRPGLDLTRADYWAARIEPGRFSMGYRHGNEMIERPEFNYTICQPYALARFPVTNRQYLIFIEALADRGTREAVAAAHELLPLLARYGQNPEYFRPKYWPGERYRTGEGNHPVVDVTWYAASAFAWWANAWLHRLGVCKTGEEVRLPTEAEWERAAAYPIVLPGGNDARATWRLYPWDNGAAKMSGEQITASVKANISESKIYGTSVVGIFPHGAADCGAEDLAGNVWEWCSTRRANYPLGEEVSAESPYTMNRPIDRDRDVYVMRGCSWNYTLDHARCTKRFGCNPKEGLGYSGLRLALIDMT